MCYDEGDCEPWKFIETNEPRARKVHRCDECRRAIPVGEHYVLVEGLSADEFSRYRFHKPCQELREFIEDVVCGGHGFVPFGYLEEEISEVGEYIDSDHKAWHAAGLAPPNPMREVFDFIKSSYPAFEAIR